MILYPIERRVKITKIPTYLDHWVSFPAHMALSMARMGQLEPQRYPETCWVLWRMLSISLYMYQYNSF